MSFPKRLWCSKFQNFSILRALIYVQLCLNLPKLKYAQNFLKSSQKGGVHRVYNTPILIGVQKFEPLVTSWSICRFFEWFWKKGNLSNLAIIFVCCTRYVVLVMLKIVLKQAFWLHFLKKLVIAPFSQSILKWLYNSHQHRDRWKYKFWQLWLDW